MTKFNEAQAKAIEAENNTLLVSAAAGSGKTTVMVEKIKQTLISHPEQHLSDMLVITFTREAASNMRRKLQAALAEAASSGSVEAANALNEIESAQISTIHSFCSQAIKNGFHVVGVDPLFRIAEETETEPLFQQAYYAAIEKIFDEDDKSISSSDRELAKDFLPILKQSELYASCQALYEALMGIPKPFDTLHAFVKNAANGPETSVWTQEILDGIRLDIRSAGSLAAQEKKMMAYPNACPKCAPIVMEDVRVVDTMLKAVDEATTIEEMLKALNAAKQAMPNITLRGLSDDEKIWYEALKSMRNAIKGSNGMIGLAISALEDIQQTKVKDLRRSQRQLRGLEVLVKVVSECFRAEKAKKNVIDYSDLEQMSYQIMTDEAHKDVRDGMLYRYTDIFVDECQDVSAIQDAIIQSLHNEKNHLFMVGDIKQSIYRFRHAEPKLFTKYRDTFEESGDATQRKIFFRDNYRSAKCVVDAVNAVFELALDRRVNELDYDPEDHLVCNTKFDSKPVDVILIDKNASVNDNEEAGTMLEAQCVAAAKKINEIIGQPTADGKGVYQYRDIAILLRAAKNDAPKMVDAFKRLHVPVMYDGAQNYFGLTEISAFTALLDIIDNNRQDVQLIAALRNVPFQFTDGELADIRIKAPDAPSFYDAFIACSETDSAIGKKCAFVRKQLEDWRYKASTMLVADFIWMLLRESSMYYVFGAYPDGQMRQNNLDMYYQKAIDWQQRGIVTLSSFMRQIHAITAPGRKDSDSPVAVSSNDNLVRIMTMHKSKGLEYKVVILMNLERDFRRKNTVASKLRIDVGTDSEERPPLGLYMPAINFKAHTINDTFGKRAHDVRATKNEIAEQTRLLYVAMTRAMERLVLIGSFVRGENANWYEPDQISRIWQTHSMLDMIMPAIVTKTHFPTSEGSVLVDDMWQLSVVAPECIPENDDVAIDKKLAECISKSAKADPSAYVKKWAVTEHEIIPPKTSVTALSAESRQVVTDEDEMGESAADKREEDAKASFTLSAMPTKPRFLEVQKPTAADAGTAAHRLLRLLHLNLFRDISTDDYETALDNELDRLVNLNIMTQEQACLINLKDIAGLLKSEIGYAIIHAQNLHREYTFTLRIDEKTHGLVQGVIDAAYMDDDGQWVIIDYKTDMDTRDEALIEKHTKQINWYRKALEDITGHPVKKMVIYALRGNKAVEIEKLAV